MEADVGMMAQSALEVTTGDANLIVQVRELSKHYAEVKALQSCTMSVSEGRIFGLLGPNGAGKTTLIRCLLGYLSPTSGVALVCGLDCHSQSRSVREQVSYLPAEAKLFRTMRGLDCIEFFSRLRPGGDAKSGVRMANRLELDLTRRVGWMSTGMRQKLALACVMSCRAKVYILDEATANLDPTVRATAIDLVREVRNGGATVLYCSHVLSEIEELCDDVAILKNGEVVYSSKLEDIRHIHRVAAFCVNGSDSLSFNESVVDFARHADKVEFQLTGELEDQLKWLSQQPLRSVRIDSSGLESLYRRFHSESSLRYNVKQR